MPQTLSLSSQVQVFPCPHCGQTINTSESACPFCKEPIDHSVAQRAAEETSTVSRAVSDASYLRIITGVAFGWIFLRFVPFISLIGVFGFIFLEFAIPFLLIRWWIRFGKLQTADPEFKPAKRNVVLISAGFVLFVLLRLTHVIVISPL